MIYQILLNTSKQYPDALAVQMPDGRQLTYAELIRAVHQWAHFLVKKDIIPGQKVGFQSKRDDWHLMIYLALDCIGACYVPLNESLFTTSNCLQLSYLFNDSDLELEDIKSLPSLIPDSAKPNQEKDLTYVMPSSGSSGKRKWIPIKGGGLAYWQDVIAQSHPRSDKEKMLCTRSPFFDARIWEYLWIFSRGASLFFLPGNKSQSDLTAIIEYCQGWQISTLIMVPAQVDNYLFKKALPQLKAAGFSHLLLTGESSLWSFIKSCHESEINVWNAYGPTESTFGMSILNVTRELAEIHQYQGPIPVASPIAPVEFSLHNDKLLIHSPFMTPGYLGDDDKNLKAFLELNGKRYFNTEDIFEFRNNFLYYRGRTLDQGEHKVLGVKIDLENILATLQGFDNPTLKVAVVWKACFGAERAVAYIEKHPDLNPTSLRKYLTDNLQPEARPLCFAIERLPLSDTSGKLDFQALRCWQDSPDDLLLKASQSLSNPNQNPDLCQSLLFIYNEYSQLGYGEWASLAETRQTEIIEFFRQLEAQLSWPQELENLQAIFTKVFKSKLTIAPDIEFKALGGSSQTAVELFVEINKQYPNRLLFSDFVKIPCISSRTLAYLLLLSQKLERNPTPITVSELTKSSQNKKKIFFIYALVGDGYYSYQQLARQYAKNHEVAIYGLSLGSLREASLKPPATLDDEAGLCYEAIKKIQPKGPYQLLGFSYGCTLAWKIGQKIGQEGEKIQLLELIDGFSPLVYQKCGREVFMEHMRSLCEYVVQLLKSNNYQERTLDFDKMVGQHYQQLLWQIQKTGAGLEPISFKKLVVKLWFDILENNTKLEASRRLIEICRLHVHFLLDEAFKPTVLPLLNPPVYYTTDRRQDYWRIMTDFSYERLPQSDSVFGMWNRYFSFIRYNAVPVPSDHIALLSNEKRGHESAETYWERAHDALFQFNIGYGPLEKVSYSKHHDHDLWQFDFMQENSQFNRWVDKILGKRTPRLIIRYQATNPLLHKQKDFVNWSLKSTVYIVPKDQTQRLIEQCSERGIRPNLLEPIEEKVHRYSGSPKMISFYLNDMENIILKYEVELPDGLEPGWIISLPKCIEARDVSPNYKQFFYVDSQLEGSVFEIISRNITIIQAFIHSLFKRFLPGSQLQIKPGLGLDPSGQSPKLR